jgi:hypothetical protein
MPNLAWVTFHHTVNRFQSGRRREFDHPGGRTWRRSFVVDRTGVRISASFHHTFPPQGSAAGYRSAWGKQRSTSVPDDWQAWLLEQRAEAQQLCDRAHAEELKQLSGSSAGWLSSRASASAAWSSLGRQRVGAGAPWSSCQQAYGSAVTAGSRSQQR